MSAIISVGPIDDDDVDDTRRVVDDDRDEREPVLMSGQASM